MSEKMMKKIRKFSIKRLTSLMSARRQKFATLLRNFYSFLCLLLSAGKRVWCFTFSLSFISTTTSRRHCNLLYKRRKDIKWFSVSPLNNNSKDFKGKGGVGNLFNLFIYVIKSQVCTSFCQHSSYVVFP